MARVLTKEQFATGTNIDGTRLDNAFSDIQQNINNVPLSQIKTRLMPYQISGGFTPTYAKFVNRLDPTLDVIISPTNPFVGAPNVTGIDCWIPQTWTFTNSPYLELASPPALADVAKKENAITQKGGLRNTDYFTLDQYVRYYQMSNVFQTSSPLIIDEISINIATGLFFQQKFVTLPDGEGTGRPPWWGYYGNGASLADMQIILSVDDEGQSEILQLRTNEFMKQDFHIWQGHMLNRKNLSVDEYLPSTGNEGLPPMTYETNDGDDIPLGFSGASLYFVFDNLNISIPENGRYRLTLLIPDYQLQENYIHTTDWSSEPWHYEMSWTITGKEEIK